jgi:hypothetical protein
MDAPEFTSMKLPSAQCADRIGAPNQLNACVVFDVHAAETRS